MSEYCVLALRRRLPLQTPMNASRSPDGDCRSRLGSRHGAEPSRMPIIAHASHRSHVDRLLNYTETRRRAGRLPGLLRDMRPPRVFRIEGPPNSAANAAAPRHAEPPITPRCHSRRCRATACWSDGADSDSECAGAECSPTGPAGRASEQEDAGPPRTARRRRTPDDQPTRTRRATRSPAARGEGAESSRAESR